MFDILPPKLARKIESEIKSLAGVEEKHNKKQPVGKHYKKAHSAKTAGAGGKRRFPLKKILAGSGVLVLILFGILYFKLQRATVEIWPKTEVLSFKEQIMADNSADTIDSGIKIIPAKVIEEEKDLWQEFPATGNASDDGKAEGTILIYNSYSPAETITLKKGTHFLSDSGKYFVTLQKVVVPAAKKQSNKTVPGSVEAKVQAAESGEDYNIKPSKFSVPKLAGTSYYYSIYAQSFQVMTGGFSSEVKKVTESDIETAKNTMHQKLLDDVKEALKNRIGGDYILLDDAIFPEIIESFPAVKAETVVDKFNYQAKAKATALVFKKSDLENFIKEYVKSNVSDPKTFLERSLSFNYNPETMDIKGGKAVLNLDFSVKTYQMVDKSDLIALFRGKSADEIKQSIESRMADDVVQVKVNFWPFWTKSAPKDKNKIKVDLRFE